MTLIEDLSSLSLNEIEAIETLTIRWLFQAVLDFGVEAYDIFLQSPDEVKDVAEDITRELLDRLPGYNIPQRIYGNVDYKRARYVLLPDKHLRQALFVDSKAEKESGTATIQMSQTSMQIRQMRGGEAVAENGHLPFISVYNQKQYLTTTAFLHFSYQDIDSSHYLQYITLIALPNGLLQEKYNPTPNDSIWLAGRNAPTRGEDFRVRVDFFKLKAKALWRIQRLSYDPIGRACNGIWED